MYSVVEKTIARRNSMVDSALSRQSSQNSMAPEKTVPVKSFKYQAEDFGVFESDFGHPDISMSVGIIKRFDLVVRKYFCNKEVGFDERLSFGELLNERSTLRFMPDCDDLRLTLICLAQKRNDLVHDFSIDKFDNEAFRRCFVDVSNIMLLEMKKLVLRPKAIDPARKSGENNHVRIIYKAEDISNPDALVPEAVRARFTIRELNDNASREDLIRFHCWKMIKLDSGLQESIKKDTDDLFYQLLPMKVEEYVAITPSPAS